MGVLTTIEDDISKLLLYGAVTIVFLIILASKLKDGNKTRSSIPHAPRLPYKLPFG